MICVLFCLFLLIHLHLILFGNSLLFNYFGGRIGCSIMCQVKPMRDNGNIRVIHTSARPTSRHNFNLPHIFLVYDLLALNPISLSSVKKI